MLAKKQAWAAVKAGKTEDERARGLRLGPEDGGDRATFDGATAQAAAAASTVASTAVAVAGMGRELRRAWQAAQGAQAG